MPKFLKDATHNGIELYFDGEPSEKYIITLKEHGWRWNPAKKCWYTADTEDNVRFAKKLCDVKKTSKALTATTKPLKDQKTQTENAKECLEKNQYEAKTSENSTSVEYEKVTENGEKTKEIIELQLIPIEKVEKEPKQRKAKNNKDNENYNRR